MRRYDRIADLITIMLEKILAMASVQSRLLFKIGMKRKSTTMTFIVVDQEMERRSCTSLKWYGNTQPMLNVQRPTVIILVVTIMSVIIIQETIMLENLFKT